ncbi:MAG: hypothetical protein R3F49_07475 [Planctomycetota bacterium]
MTSSQLARRIVLYFPLFCAALTSQASAQSPVWIRQLGTAGGEEGYALAPDGSGGVFLCGFTGDSLGGPSAGGADCLLARFDAAGNQTWLIQFGTDRDDWARAVAPDGAGGVFVSGHTRGSLGGPSAGGLDVWLARFDPAGNQLWVRQFGTNFDEESSAAAADGLGGVWVCGQTQGNLGGSNAGNGDAWLARFDGSGNQSWIRQLGSNAFDSALAVAFDQAGGAFVGGKTRGELGGQNPNGSDDAWVAHYDGAGTQSWFRQLGTSAFDGVSGLAVAGAGGVFLTGVTRGDLGGVSGGSYDAWVALYDSGGGQVWIRQFGTSGDDRSNAAAPDGLGGVYLGGYTDGALGGPNAGSADVWVALFDSAGNRTWVNQYGSGSVDIANAVASDAAGGVYALGATTGSLGGPHAGGSDVWLARDDRSLPTVRYCTPAISNSTGQSAVLTAMGSNVVQVNDVTLVASSLPANSLGLFLTSRDQGNVFPVSHSQGRLCVGGLIGRYIGPGQVKSSGAAGMFSLALDLTNMAHPFSPVTAQPGHTWYFQAWFRDANPSATSNFTDAVGVTFL